MPRSTSCSRPAVLPIALLLACMIGFACPAWASEAPLESFINYLEANQARYGLVADDFSDVRVTDLYQTHDTGVTHIYLRQQVNGIDVLTSHANANILPDERVVLATVRFHPNLDRSRHSGQPLLSAIQVAGHVAAKLNLGITTPLIVLDQTRSVDAAQTLSDGGISEDPIPARLVYIQTERNGLRLAWELLIDPIGRPNYWQIAADAETGEILKQYDWTVEHNQANIALSEPRPLADRTGHRHDHDHVHAPIKPLSSMHGLETRGANASYRVFGLPYESPTAPDAVHALIVNPAHPEASPFGWHDTDGTPTPNFTITRGNNVHAYLDTSNNNSPDPGSEPDGGPGLVFDFAFNPALSPSDGTNPQASVVNLFYWSNVTHDLLYVHGFDEPSGNFQVNNYGNGGIGDDDVRAEGQDGGGINNANFFTPPDGSRPRMQMFNWNQTTPHRDGNFDAGIVAHEYGHGWSIRLTGGPSVVNCLTNTEQMGEGWSDFLSVVFTAQVGDTRTTNRGVGTYALGQPPDGNGIRLAPYNTDMAVNGYTYANLPDGSVSVPHGVGFIWNTMLWEMYWNLVDEYGFNPNLYDDWTTGGNNLTLRLVSDGLKMQTCSPGFVDGRNAILAADQALTGGANQCLIWDAFAKRGLGFSADQGSPNSRLDGTPAFDMPDICLGLSSPVETINVCQGGQTSFDVSAGNAFTSLISMSAVGNPAPTTVGFSPNPINPGQSTSVTIVNTGDVAAGSYPIDIVGDDGSFSDSLAIDLIVSSEAPAAAQLQSPANGAANISSSPNLSWTVPAQGESFLVEIATNASFSNIVYSDTVSGNNVNIAGLNTATLYYWRVTAGNACGHAQSSTVFSFSTEALPGDCLIDEVADVFLFENFEGGAPGWASSGTGNTWQLSQARANSGDFSFHAANSPTVSDQRLVSPPVALPTDANSLNLNFWNYQIIEHRSAGGCWDGAIIEISTDAGTSWTQLTSSTHPYDGLIQSGFSNPLAGLDGWCGDPRPWHRPVVNLDAYAGQTVQFRFRLGTDNSVSREGWYIDDVRVQACVDAPIPVNIGGTVSDLIGSGLELVNNGSDNLVINGSGSFTFATQLVAGDAYDVMVVDGPSDPYQSCAVFQGSGTVGDSDITNVAVDCFFEGLFADAGGSQTVPVGTLVTLDGSNSEDFDGNPLNFAWSDLSAAGIVIDNESLMVASFVAPSEPMVIEVQLEVDNGYGINGIDSVYITVEDIAIGDLNAANEGPGLVNEAIGLSASVGTGSNVAYHWDFGDGNIGSGAAVNHSYTMPGIYTATVTASNDAGSAQAHTEVTVIGLYAVGGTAFGVSSGGLVLSINGDEQLAINEDGVFSFPTTLPDGSHFQVSIVSQIDDPNRICRVINGTGTLDGSDIGEIEVICSDDELFDDRFETSKQ
jgi:hypothetical protein